MLGIKDFNLREGERIKKLVKHHRIVLIPGLVISFLILVLDFFLFFWLMLQGWWGMALFTAVIFAVVFNVSRLMFLFNNNLLIITDQRILDFEQVGFFKKFTNEFGFYEINKAHSVTKGVFGTIFRYGSLKLDLRNKTNDFEIFKVPKPDKLQSVINELVERETRNMEQIKHH